MKINMKCMDVEMVKMEDVYANDYNPNIVAKPELELLKTSIIQNGFCFPIVVIKDKKNKYCVVDGFHRYTVMKDMLKQEEIGVVVLEQTMEERITATVQFNRARGTHQILDMSKIVLKLIKEGLSDSEISQKLGMDAEEILRLKQITGLKEAFQNRDFSKSWDDHNKKFYDKEKNE